MMKALKRIPMTYVGYLGFLLTFAGLGLFVNALAMRSVLAWVLGAAAVASMVLCVAGFRIGARQRAAANTAGTTLDNMDIFSPPMTKEEVDRYLLRYRGEPSGEDRVLRSIDGRAGEAVPEAQPQAA
ncbi:hypothetical protein [Mycolicibacterium thermoresistibile]|nr:hypothetical protein [Mycolicibacterium thermoresistibile]MCV7189982.1 hypothetical protein [Mycolicibacterium thermoresistibile]GAT13964.1 putative uncharacterized protein [Mycolicibacterium thermoresistibile]SNW19137.1 Uncharacterised protein [Mycolicibacterium thermoresistibile]